MFIYQSIKTVFIFSSYLIIFVLCCIGWGNSSVTEWPHSINWRLRLDLLSAGFQRAKRDVTRLFKAQVPESYSFFSIVLNGSVQVTAPEPVSRGEEMDASPQWEKHVDMGIRGIVWVRPL